MTHSFNRSIFSRSQFTQAAYRIGDSCTNIISPMMTCFALIAAFMERYQSKAGIGTVIALMLPYSMAFLLAWTILLIAWMLLGLPVGPGAGLYLMDARRRDSAMPLRRPTTFSVIKCITWTTPKCTNAKGCPAPRMRQERGLRHHKNQAAPLLARLFRRPTGWVNSPITRRSFPRHTMHRSVIVR